MSYPIHKGSRVIKFSVIVPTYNRRQLLELTLDALLAQDYPRDAYEIIVIDDGSKDDTVAFLENFQSTSTVSFCFASQINQGPAAARNRAIAKARFEWIAMTDDDCLPAPDWLSQFAAGADAHLEAVGLEGRTVCPNPHPLGHWVENVKGGSYITANMAYRRDVLVKIGGLDTEFPFPQCEDTELAWRCLAVGPIPFCHQALVLHPNREQGVVAQMKQSRYNLSEFYLHQKLGREYAAFRRFPAAWMTVGLVLFIVPLWKSWRFRSFFKQNLTQLGLFFLVSVGKIVYFFHILVLRALRPPERRACR